MKSKRLKRALGIIIAAVMIFSLIPVMAFAEEVQETQVIEAVADEETLGGEEEAKVENAEDEKSEKEEAEEEKPEEEKTEEEKIEEEKTEEENKEEEKPDEEHKEEEKAPEEIKEEEKTPEELEKKEEKLLEGPLLKAPMLRAAAVEPPEIPDGHIQFLYENFESGSMPSGWTAGSGWKVGTGDYYSSTGAHTGEYNALDYDSSNYVDTYLVTPYLDLADTTEGKISLWYINRSDSGYQDGFGVYYRVMNGSWTELFYTSGEAHEEWTKLELDIPEEAAQTGVQFGLDVYRRYGYGVGVDDVLITAKEGEPLETPVRVNITLGDNMTWVEGSGALNQTGITQKIEPIKIKADLGYYFSASYSLGEGSNGLAAMPTYEDGYSYITIAGKPSADINITLSNPTADTYQLWIGGVQVNGSNINDILGDDTASFEPNERVLTLNNCTQPIEFNMGGELTIEGTANIVTDNNYAVRLCSDGYTSSQSKTFEVTFNGDFTFIGASNGIYAYNSQRLPGTDGKGSTINIEGGSLYAEGTNKEGSLTTSRSGIYCIDLNITNAEVTCKGANGVVTGQGVYSDNGRTRYIYGDININCPGKKVIFEGAGTGVYCLQGSCTISGGNVEMTGTKTNGDSYGYYSYSSVGHFKITGEDTVVKFKGNTAAFRLYSSDGYTLQYDDTLDIVTPIEGVCKKGSNATYIFERDEETYAKEAEISKAYEKYDLYVGGRRATIVNKDNILWDEGTPRASYDPNTKTLTLNNYVVDKPEPTWTSTYSEYGVYRQI